MAATGRPLRADAARNRTLILDAARAAFADGGLDVGVEEIARRAGVGKGTLYRRFPTKEALVRAIFDDILEDFMTTIFQKQPLDIIDLQSLGLQSRQATPLCLLSFS